MSIQNHVHLQLTTDNAEDGKYGVKHGSLDDTPQVPMVVDRALNSTPYFHRVLNDTGDPILITHHSFVIICTSRSQLDGLLSKVAKPIYYIPSDHPADGDTSGHTTARQNVVMTVRPGSVTNIDPAMQYWQVAVELFDND